MFIEVIHCPATRPISYGQYEPTSCANSPQLDYNTVCNITCDSGYDNSWKNTSIRCEADKLWSHNDENMNCSC